MCIRMLVVLYVLLELYWEGINITMLTVNKGWLNIDNQLMHFFYVLFERTL